jgi:hypothetical protein
VTVINKVEYHPYDNIRNPCKEHAFYTATYRFEIYPMELIDIPISICDYCGAVFVTERGWRGTVESIQKVVARIVRKESSKMSPLCRLKRKIKWIIKGWMGETKTLKVDPFQHLPDFVFASSHIAPAV